MTLIYVATVFVALLSIGLVYGEIRVMAARRRGIYPSKGKVTIDDVKGLALKGEEILAMRAYREMRGVSLKEAKKVIKDIVDSAGKEQAL